MRHSNPQTCAGAKGRFREQMKVYIQEITQHPKTEQPTALKFTDSREDAWFWKTEGDAERAISIWETPDRAPVGCTDFRVESRPQGGFVISCDRHAA
jgi:hypothetical protein